MYHISINQTHRHTHRHTQDKPKTENNPAGCFAGRGLGSINITRDSIFVLMVIYVGEVKESDISVSNVFDNTDRIIVNHTVI